MPLTREQFNEWCKRNRACKLATGWMNRPENINLTPREILDTCPHGSWLWWILGTANDLDEECYSAEYRCYSKWVSMPFDWYDTEVIDERSMRFADWIRTNVRPATWDRLEAAIEKRLAEIKEFETCASS